MRAIANLALALALLAVGTAHGADTPAPPTQVEKKPGSPAAEKRDTPPPKKLLPPKKYPSSSPAPASDPPHQLDPRDQGLGCSA